MIGLVFLTSAPLSPFPFRAYQTQVSAHTSVFLGLVFFIEIPPCPLFPIKSSKSRLPSLILPHQPKNRPVQVFLFPVSLDFKLVLSPISSGGFLNSPDPFLVEQSIGYNNIR